MVGKRLYTFNFLGNIYEIRGDSLIDIPVSDWVLSRNYVLLSSGFDDKLSVSTNNGIFSYNLEIGKWSVAIRSHWLPMIFPTPKAYVMPMEDSGIPQPRG